MPNRYRSVEWAGFTLAAVGLGLLFAGLLFPSAYVCIAGIGILLAVGGGIVGIVGYAAGVEVRAQPVLVTPPCPACGTALAWTPYARWWCPACQQYR